uniref:Uncharacterized protein n=1 Tax=Arundo donax TaxID=35708 RepID=A0A0A9BY48_ARUDO
MHGIWGVRRCR